VAGDHPGITIPRPLIDAVADAIVASFARRPEPRIKQIFSSETPRPGFDDPRPWLTFPRIGEVSDRVWLARSTIFGKAVGGGFPKSGKPGERTAAWRLEDSEAWERGPLGYGK